MTSVVTLLKVKRSLVSKRNVLSSQKSKNRQPKRVSLLAMREKFTARQCRRERLVENLRRRRHHLSVSFFPLSSQLRRRRYQFLKSWLRPILIRHCKWRWCVCFINESISARRPSQLKLRSGARQMRDRTGVHAAQKMLENVLICTSRLPRQARREIDSAESVFAFFLLIMWHHFSRDCAHVQDEKQSFFVWSAFL